jgi:glycosyltransferase involved in cell wall biosynthesis
VRLLFVGNFAVTQGSGYATILEHICSELAALDHKITILGTFWDRSEHTYPFQVLATDWTWIPVHVMRLHQALNFDHVILAMDVPKIDELLNEVERQNLVWPKVSAIFPIESDPLIDPWAKGLNRLYRRFVISRFGQGILSEASLESIYVPMTAELSERIPKPEARAGLKDYVNWGNADLLDSNGLMALTVADNQERKALPVIAQALARVREIDNVTPTWLLVTRYRSPYGWYLPDILERAEMAERTLIFEALPAPALDRAYWAADCFVIASQAEGACLPLYEAMAHDLPCIGPDHTAISEALADGRGTLVSCNGRTIHPAGNVHRYHTRVEDLTKAIVNISHPGDDRLVDFVKGRPWEKAALAIEEELVPNPNRETGLRQEVGLRG